jgi:hypothetical protein
MICCCRDEDKGEAEAVMMSAVESQRKSGARTNLEQVVCEDNWQEGIG